MLVRGCLYIYRERERYTPCFQGTLVLLHQLLVAEGSIRTTDGSEVGALMLCMSLKVGHLLQEYADYLVGDICFQLRFEANSDAQLAPAVVWPWCNMPVRHLDRHATAC